MVLLSAEEVAKKLGVSKGLVYQLKAQHKIPFVLIGKALKFNEEDIERWVVENTVQARAK